MIDLRRIRDTVLFLSPIFILKHRAYYCKYPLQFPAAIQLVLKSAVRAITKIPIFYHISIDLK